MCRGTRTNALHESAGREFPKRASRRRSSRDWPKIRLASPFAGRDSTGEKVRWRGGSCDRINSRADCPLEAGGSPVLARTWGIMFGFGSPVVDRGFWARIWGAIEEAAGFPGQRAISRVWAAPLFQKCPASDYLSFDIRPGFPRACCMSLSQQAFTGQPTLPRLHACVVPCRQRARKHIGDQFRSYRRAVRWDPVLLLLFFFFWLASHRDPAWVAAWQKNITRAVAER